MVSQLGLWLWRLLLLLRVASSTITIVLRSLLRACHRILMIGVIRAGASAITHGFDVTPKFLSYKIKWESHRQAPGGITLRGWPQKRVASDITSEK